ncbi:MAG: FtsX-like permease family protein [Alcaligenaceae bacterium]|nr:FtsX-like permease family protein [Alcaligenaceae bacterium]
MFLGQIVCFYWQIIWLIWGVQIRGIDPDYEHEVSELPEQIISDDGVEVLSKKSFNIVIGRQLANNLGLFVGDDVLILAPQGSMSPSGFTPRMKRFKIAGLFDSGLYEYDSSLVFMNDFDAKVFLRGSGRSGIRLKINDMLKAPQVKRELQAQFQNRGVYLTDWTQINKSWFSAVKTEKTMMGLILFLIVAVAAFNLLSSLVMVVKDKQSDIAILRSLGATKSVILRIFMIQGSLIGLLGTSIGLVLGTLIAYRMESIFNGIQWLLGIEVLDPSIYLISTLPSQPELSVIALIGVSSFALSFLFTIYPSLRAARLEPAQVLRHD